MADDECTCAALATSQPARLTRWRDVCTRFFLEHDAVAKRVIDHFENSSAEQIVIETSDLAPTSEDVALQEIIASLRFTKCPVAGHDESYNDEIVSMERIKNEVRSGYHRLIALKNYEAFDKHVLKAGLSTNLDPWTNPDGSQHLIIRIHEHYVRSATAQMTQRIRVEEFLKEHIADIAYHPFLAGLRRMLEWNLGSPTVVAWKVADATFVESGTDFAHAAVKVLIQDLNCGHLLLHTTKYDPTNHHRMWYLDPYMSDYDIKQLIKLFPAPTQLQSSGTGDRVPTDVHRANADGAHDEHQSFFQKWCVIL